MWGSWMQALSQRTHQMRVALHNFECHPGAGVSPGLSPRMTLRRTQWLTMANMPHQKARIAGSTGN
eukprot:3056612-Rhodomonas_salina.1